jgi:co-chaperonin GroES (HSP10)
MINKDFSPFYDNLLIRRRELGNESTGGIIITVQEGVSNSDGEVVKLGPDCKVVKVGDHVLYDAHNGSLITVGDEELVYISEETLLGKFHE